LVSTTKSTGAADPEPIPVCTRLFCVSSARICGVFTEPSVKPAVPTALLSIEFVCTVPPKMAVLLPTLSVEANKFVAVASVLVEFWAVKS